MSGQAKVTEIFRSIQGEGKYLGTQQVFIRFHGCNLNCQWCDTAESNKLDNPKVKIYNPETLTREIETLVRGCHSISLTGGEPLLHVDFLKEFIPLIRGYNLPILLETNGSLAQAFLEVAQGIDIVSMDIKLPSSTGCEPIWDEHVDFLRAAWGKDIFIKTVISKDTAQEDIVHAVEVILQGDAGMPLFLQPNHFELNHDLLEKCMAFQEYCSKYLNDVRIVPQVHKFMRIP